MDNVGYTKGEVCNRNGCTGIIMEDDDIDGGCSCHINPPCSYCTTPKGYCDECGWVDEVDDSIPTTYKPIIPEYKRRTVADLDNSKIDYISKPHTHFSMIKEGVYPIGTSVVDVVKVVKGSFGGRFVTFGDGKFKYIAYTD